MEQGHSQNLISDQQKKNIYIFEYPTECYLKCLKDDSSDNFTHNSSK